jgi:predicted aminopeptidase
LFAAVGSSFLPAVFLPLTLWFTSCSPAYVLRAGYEEAKILWRREPIEQMVKRPDLDKATRAKLETVLAVRTFARDALHLKVDGSYASVARVDTDQLVHVVSAAYRDRLELYTWWFPIVGRVPYKGFFSKADADAEAAALERKGYDTFVRPSPAFSTLGWFADPLLSNLLSYDRAGLASVVIHELLHNTTYLAGRADFDESFATFVGDRGAIQFFSTRKDSLAILELSALWADELQFSNFLGRFAGDLRAAYAAGVTPEQRTALFNTAQADFRQLQFFTHVYEDFGTQPLNNAVILHYLIYADRLQMFEDLFQQQDKDVGRTITVVLDAIRNHHDDPFAAVQAQLQTAEH